MNKTLKKIALVLAVTGFAAVSTGAAFAQKKLIAIANFGEHPQLNAVVEGVQAAVKAAGVDAEFTVDHVNFDATLLPQMFAKIEATNPDIIVGITTPVAQNMLNQFKDSGKPMLFGAVTDPVAAQLVPGWEKGGKNITGAADALDIRATLEFITRLFPDAKVVGIPYNPSEANDVATLELFQNLASDFNVEIASVGVDNTNDIIARVTSLATKADVIYGPTSNLIQPAISAVASATKQAGKPLVNSGEAPVQEGLAQAGFTVSYYKIGELVGDMAVRILAGESAESIPPRGPSYEDHLMLISRSAMAEGGWDIPEAFKDCGCIVE